MALNPILPVAGLGAALLFFLTSKKSGATTPEGQGAPPNVLKPPTNRPTSELSEQQRERMAQALGKLGVSPATGKLSGAADAEAIRFATQVIGELEQDGFKDAANALRVYVDEAAKSVRTPVEANPIAQAASSVMTKEQAEYIARVLSLERDPKKIATLITMLKALPASPERDNFIQMAQALALQIEAANATAQTLDKIDQVIKSSPDEPDEEVYTATSPGQPTGRPPAAGTPVTQRLPEKPTAVPATPVPQTPPASLTEIELVGRALLTNLITMQQKHGVKGAKGREDKALVKKFQALAGLTADGAAGPATNIMLATKGALQLPYVYYWPKNSTAATVAEYRSTLEKLAQKLESLGRRDHANTLRVSIAREHGESGIQGPLYGAPAAPVKAPTNVVPLRAPAAGLPPHLAAIPDPAPTARVLKSGSKGADVQVWQNILTQAGYGSLVGKPDGIFGRGTDAAARAFQTRLGLTPDGALGANSRRGAVYLSLWPRPAAGTPGV